MGTIHTHRKRVDVEEDAHRQTNERLKAAVDKHAEARNMNVCSLNVYIQWKYLFVFSFFIIIFMDKREEPHIHLSCGVRFWVLEWFF